MPEQGEEWPWLDHPPWRDRGRAAISSTQIGKRRDAHDPEPAAVASLRIGAARFVLDLPAAPFTLGLASQEVDPMRTTTRTLDTAGAATARA